MNLDGQQITIIGAGIGGLAAALAFVRLGAEVTVLEQANEISEVGAGIQISPNGGAVLSGLGLEADLKDISLQATAANLCDYRAGRSVLRLPLDNSTFNQPYRFVHRSDLIDLLAKAAISNGVNIKTSCQISHVELDNEEMAVVHVADGSILHPDLLIGADGIHSVVRRAMNGKETPFFTQQVAWRCLVPLDRRVPNEATVFMGPGRHLVTYPLRQGQVMNIVAVEERTTWTEEGWNHQDNPENLKSAFAGFCPQVQELLNRVEIVHLWGLFRHRVAPVWTHEACAILGDAAHPTLPFMAQGATMALEDAWALAACLKSANHLSEGMERYQKIRKPRATAVVNAATKNARNYHLSAAPVRWIAHSALRGIGTVAPGMMLRKFDWIYGYDVTKDPTLQAASSTQTGT